MSDEYVLYYWPLAGRGEFVRLIFEEVGQPFKDVDNIDEIKAMCGARGPQKEGFPNFAPPILKKGKSLIYKKMIMSFMKCFFLLL